MSSGITKGIVQDAVEHKYSLSAISVSFRTTTCDPGEPECLEHCNIEACAADVNIGQAHTTISQMKLYRQGKAVMKRVSPTEMWQQCQAYDLMHFGGKLNKIENFLANESFFERQFVIANAEEVVYVEEVVLHKKARGQGLGLVALSQTIAQLRLPQKTILLLEPGGIGQLDAATLARSLQSIGVSWAFACGAILIRPGCVSISRSSSCLLAWVSDRSNILERRWLTACSRTWVAKKRWTGSTLSRAVLAWSLAREKRCSIKHDFRTCTSRREACRLNGEYSLEWIARRYR